MRAGSGATQRYRASLPAIWSALLAVYLIWGSTYLAIRFAVETAPPFLSAAARFMVSGAALYLWRRAAGDTRPTLAEWRGATVIGVLLLVGGPAASFGRRSSFPRASRLCWWQLCPSGWWRWNSLTAPTGPAFVPSSAF